MGAQLLPARRYAAAAAALSLTAGACFLLSTTHAKAQASAATCEDAADLAVLSAPIAPWKGMPLRVIFAAEKPLDGELSLIAPNGSVVAASRERHGGPPYFWFAEVAAPAAGTWHAQLARAQAPSGCQTITRDITVLDREPPRPHSVDGSLWPIRYQWNRATENLYSAWIEKLFDAPLDAEPSWKALHEVLRDKSRNVLFNYLGLGEDQTNVAIKPDCADMPYFLRAYFAFKLGLPFGYSNCSRGAGGDAPKCFAWWNIEKPEEPRAIYPEEIAASAPPQPALDMFGRPIQQIMTPIMAPAPRPVGLSLATAKRLGLSAMFAKYIPIVGDAVHSGSGRTAANDDNTDYYPVPLTQDALRPGTIYADPYGHVLMLARRLPQTADAAGVFFAIDAQPDGTVARKRFWRGNFLFAQDRSLGGPGFKRFRPIVQEKNGTLRRLTNDEITKNPQYSNFSLEQSRLSVEDFYDRMDDVMSPEPLDPVRAMKEAITSLEEQVKARVTSVENGRKFQLSGRGDAQMPDGATIFETTGAWEDFATPSRDLRLLIAIDVVRTFPDRVARRPDRYAMPAGKSVADVKAELQSVLATELAARKFAYPRTDGSQWTLTLKQVLDRASDLEMAYNVNDCVELRWGATNGSDEAATCRRRAPQLQRAKMTDYRAWFHERRRPPRA
jgi:hypothetical protein